MPIIVGDNTDFTQKQLLNAVAQGVVADPSGVIEGQFWYRTDLHRLCFFDGTAVRRIAFRLDQLDPPTADVSLNSHKIANLADPTVATDAVTKQYADGLMQGVSWKDSVRVASTDPFVALSGLPTMDGVALAAGNRVLLKNQQDLGASASTNGIYIAAAGAWTRAVDADTAGDIQGATVSVDEGSQAGTIWNQTADSVTLGTTPLLWVKISQLSDLIAGAGLTKTSNTVDVVAADGSITVNPDSITVGNVSVAKGGTGAVTAAAARTNLVVPSRVTINVSGGTAYNMVHNLNAQGVIVTVIDTTTGQEVHVGQIRADQNTQVVDLSLLSGTVTYSLTAVG